MFTCKNCTRNLLRAVLSVESSTLLHARRFLPFTTLKTSYSTQLHKQNDPETQARIDAGLPADIQTYGEAAVSVLKGENPNIAKYRSRNASAKEPVEDISVVDGVTPIDAKKLNKHALLELQWLSESYKLADRVKILVQNGEVDQALALVRLAGRSEMNTTVSWNHVLNGVSKLGQLETARKLFNEMKKRSVQPDSYTISVMLRGYTEKAKKYPQQSSTLANAAMKIYMSTYGPNSSVKTSIIHSNIMLEICARSGQITLMFEVAANLPSKGPNSPNDITYTTILNALKHIELQGEAKEDRAAEQQKIISQAKRIWSDVIAKWKTGTLAMDEGLVCAMGGILMKGTREDRSDILSLLQQTVRLPREMPNFQEARQAKLVQRPAQADSNRLGEKETAAKIETLGDEETTAGWETPADLNAMFDEYERNRDTSSAKEHMTEQDRPEITVRRDKINQDHSEVRAVDDVINQDQLETVRWSAAEGISSSSDVALAETKDQVDNDLSPLSTEKAWNDFPTVNAAGLVHPKLGNQVLSLALQACSSIHRPAEGERYWNLVTRKIKPDEGNYVDYFKLLQIDKGRNSKTDSSKSTDLLLDIYKAYKGRDSDIRMQPVFFYHAMCSCGLDKHNSNALRNATRVLAILDMCMSEPQPLMVSIFCEVLTNTRVTYPTADVVRGVEALMITFANLKSLEAYGRTDVHVEPPPPSDDLVEVFRELNPYYKVKSSGSERVVTGYYRNLEIRSGIPWHYRGELFRLGRTIETAMSRVLRANHDNFTPEQLRKIKSDLFRIRAWVFPRREARRNAKAARIESGIEVPRDSTSKYDIAGGEQDNVAFLGEDVLPRPSRGAPREERDVRDIPTAESNHYPYLHV